MIGRPHEAVVRSVQSLTTRKYLLGAVLGWVLVVYLVAAPSPSAAPVVPSPSRVPARQVVTPQPAAPVVSAPAPPIVAPTVTTAPLSGDFPTLSFGSSGTPPPATAPLDCPYPIPQSQTTPFSPGIFLSFEGPFFELSGPFVIYDIPTLGAIAPLVPFLTPLVYISEPVLNALTPNLSTVVTDYTAVIDDLGLDSPQEQQYATEFEPYYLELLDALSPVESELASSTAGQCLELFENELAVMDSQQNISLPDLPLVPPGIPPGSSSAETEAVEAATTADGIGALTQLVLPWSGGVPTDLAAAESALRTNGHPVELELVDDPPAGQAMGGTGFSDFVAEAVHDSPEASAFEVAAPATDPSGTAQTADLVHGLASADMERLPGQVIGVGVPDSAAGTGAGAFWSVFDKAMKGWQADMVDFVAADLTPRSEATPAAADVEAVSVARNLESAFTALGGVPADVPVFGAVSLAGPGPWSTSSVQEQIAAYLGALHGLRVSVLGVDTGG